VKRVFYSSGSIRTGDRTAQVVLDYASALAQRETSDAIEIPILTESGALGTARLLLGPASQIMSVTEDVRVDEVDDDEVLDLLARRIDGLLRPKGRPVDEADLNRSSGATDALGPVQG